MTTTAKRGIIVLSWAGLIIAWVMYQRSTGLGTTESLQQFIDVTRGAWWAFLAFVLIYAVRPLALLPAGLMTIAGGLLFGPIVGVAATVVGANASAMTAYWVARSLGFAPSEDPEAAGLLKRWSDRMRRESFVTIMIMRLAFLPYDLVNYAAGFLRIKPLQFLLATAIGSLPGTIAFTLAGASIESLDEGVGGIDPAVLIVSVVVFIISVGVSILIKRRPGMDGSEQAAPETNTVLI